MTHRNLTKSLLSNHAASGKSWRELAKSTGIPCSTIRRVAAANGITSRYTSRREMSAERKQLWVAQLLRGKATEDIAKAEGMSRQTVHAQLVHSNLPTTTRDAARQLFSGLLAKKIPLPKEAERIAGAAKELEGVAA